MRQPTLLIALILLAACSSLPEPEYRVPDPEESARFLLLEDALDRGDPAAERLLLDFLERWPESVDGRRLLQNLRIASGEGWRVHEEAAAAHAAAPADAALAYLHARTVPDRALQADLFSRVIEQDPSCFFGWYGLGVAALDAGDADTALQAARGALAVRPADPAAMVLLAGVLERSGRWEDAELIYGQVLGKPGQRIGPLLATARRAERIGRGPSALGPVLDALAASPNVPGLTGMAWSLLAAPGVREAEVGRALGLARAGSSGVSLLLRARCHALLGDPRQALLAFNAVARTEVRGFVSRDEWFAVAVAAGEYRQALAIEKAGRPDLLAESPPDAGSPGADRLWAALLAADRSPASAAALAELSRSLSRTGFGRAATDCAARALALRPADPDLQMLLADALAWESFLHDARLIFARLGEEGRRGAAGPSLDQVLELLARASIRRLGHDVVTDIPEQSYPFVGAVIRTDAPGSPVSWVERGTLLVLGQRAGASVTAVTMRLVGRLAGLSDGDVGYELAVGRGSSITTDGTGLGAVAGFTLPGWIVIDLDVIDRTAARIQREAAMARGPDLWPAGDEATRRSLWFPGGVRERLSARIGDPGEEVLLATLAHERGHAVDAARFVPFLPNFPLALLEFASHGFSPTSVEVGLERTAEIRALQTSPDRRVALANTLLFLPHERSAPPHSLAYHGIVRELVAEIDSHPGEYPSIDRDFNILQQLDRLTDAELSRLIDRALP